MKPVSLSTGMPAPRVLTAGAWWPGRPGCHPDPTIQPDAAAERMRRLFLIDGVARFSVSFVADAASRVRLVPSYLTDDGRWEVATELNSPLDELRAVTTAIELGFESDFGDARWIIWSGIHHKRVSGQAYIVVDGSRGARRFNVYGPKAMTRASGGMWQIADAPGVVRTVPDSNVFRIWTPHPDHPLQPYSPLWAGISDIERLRLLNETLERTASSQLLSRGLLWFPGEAMDDMVTVDGKRVPRVVESYYRAAAQTMQEGLDHTAVEAVAPFAMWWDSDLGEPKLIRLGMPFDAHWHDLRNVALEDWARSTDLPSVIVLNGGAGGSGSNHWSELLVDRRTFDMTVARDLDPFVRRDLTRFVLRPLLIDAELPSTSIQRWRVDYDPTDLLVNQDRTLFAVDALRFGLISVDAARRRLGFRDDEAATASDIAHVLDMAVRVGDVTRRRREQESSDMGGAGTQVNLPTAP